MPRHTSLIVVLAAAVLVGAPATAVAQIAGKKYMLMTPLFTPKNGSNSTLVFASGNEASETVNLRRYNAVGGLMSSTNVGLGAKSSIIAFAGANSGAQMHIEIHHNLPAVQMELTYTDPGDAVVKIDAGDMLRLGPEQGVPDSIAAVQNSVNALGDPIASLQSGVSLLGTVPSKLDSIAADVAAVRGAPAPPADARVGTLQTELASVKREVTRLRAELRSLRKSLLRRLPRRR